MNLFVRVVDDGSFSAAARHLEMTPSSVSRQISRLEEELGARLFHRTTRKQSLTEAGELYLGHARRIVSDVEAARMAVRRLADTPTGSLHVAVEADIAVTFLAPILPDFLDLYPDVRVRLSMSATLVDLIDGGVDLAIRMGHLEESSLIARRIAMSRSQLYASPGYLSRNGTPTHPRELAAHSCLSFRVQAGRNNWRFEEGDGSLDVPVSGRVNANSLVFLKSMAVAGRGIIMIPTWTVREELERGQLVLVLEGFPSVPPATPISAVFAHNRHLAPKVRAFVDFLAKHMNARC